MDLSRTNYFLSAVRPGAGWGQPVAQIVSAVFSPPLLTLAAVLLIAAHLPSPESRPLAGLYAAFILLLPILCIGWLKRRGRVSDFDLSVRQERIVPMLVAWLGVVLGGLALQQADAPRLLLAFALLQILQGVVFLLITLFWKISLHTTAVSSLVALWWLVSEQLLPLWLGPLLLLIVLVAWARLRLRRHTAGQTIAGATLGILACLTVWQIY